MERALPRDTTIDAEKEGDFLFSAQKSGELALFGVAG